MSDAETPALSPKKNNHRTMTPRFALVTGGAVLLAVTALFGWNFLNRPDAVQLAAQGKHLMDRDPEEAAQLLRSAIELSRDRLPDSEVSLCLLLVRKRDWNSVLPIFAKLDRNACSEDFLLEFGRFAHRTGHDDEAIEALSVVRRRNSTRAFTVLELLGQIYQERRNERELLDCVRDMALLNPDDATLWWKLLKLLDARQLSTESIAHIRLALQQKLPQRDQIEMRHQLITRLVSQGQIADAGAELLQLPEGEHPLPRTKRHRAALARLEGKPQQALAFLEASQSMSIDQPGVAWLRGQIRFDLNQFDDAIKDCLIVLKADPFDLTVHLKLAESYRATAQLELARQYEESSRRIREKRQQINRLKEKAIRQKDDRSIPLELARLHRELNDHRGTAFWEKRAAEPGAASGDTTKASAAAK